MHSNIIAGSCCWEGKASTMPLAKRHCGCNVWMADSLLMPSLFLCCMFCIPNDVMHCMMTAQEKDSVLMWYSAKYDSFFISTAVVPDQDGSWQGVLTYARLEVVQQPYGLGPGKVFTPWSSKDPTEIFSLHPLEELQAENELLKQQMASMQRLYDVTVARGTASGSAGSAVASWLQAGANLGFFWLSFLGVLCYCCFPPLSVFFHAFACQHHCATTACCANCRARAPG